MKLKRTIDIFTLIVCSLIIACSLFTKINIDFSLLINESGSFTKTYLIFDYFYYLFVVGNTTFDSGSLFAIICFGILFYLTVRRITAQSNKYSIAYLLIMISYSVRFFISWSKITQLEIVFVINAVTTIIMTVICIPYFVYEFIQTIKKETNKLSLIKAAQKISLSLMILSIPLYLSLILIQMNITPFLKESYENEFQRYLVQLYLTNPSELIPSNFFIFNIINIVTFIAITVAVIIMTKRNTNNS